MMDTDRTIRRSISRRVLLHGTALTFAAVATTVFTPRAAAQQKVSQADIQYQNKPNAGQRCAGCINFQAPKSCKFVQGDISPDGWCALFSPKS